MVGLNAALRKGSAAIGRARGPAPPGTSARLSTAHAPPSPLAPPSGRWRPRARLRGHGGGLCGDGAGGGASFFSSRSRRRRAGFGRAGVRAGQEPEGGAVPALRLPGAAARSRHLRLPRAAAARHEEEGGGDSGRRRRRRRRGRAAGALAGARHVLLRERGLHPRRGQRQVPGVRRLRGRAHRLALPGRQGQLLRGAGARGPRVTLARGWDGWQRRVHPLPGSPTDRCDAPARRCTPQPPPDRGTHSAARPGLQPSPRGSGIAGGRAAEQHSGMVLQGSSVSRMLGAVPGLHGCSVTPCVAAVLHVLGCLRGDWFVAQAQPSLWLAQSRRRKGLLC